MFTGIVSAVGQVIATGGALEIEAPSIAAELAVAGSVSVNGACLTAVEVTKTRFRVQTVDETLRRTALGRLGPGGRVNLELPVRAGQPLDGHLVLGHVDGVGTVSRVVAAALGWEVSIEAPAELAAYIAEKGSIAVDGVSLTVTAAGDRSFGVALIPYTLEHTIAGSYEPGSSVNLEVDVLARYVERLVRAGIGKG